MDTGLV